jgi:beta-hydroxylase
MSFGKINKIMKFTDKVIKNNNFEKIKQEVDYMLNKTNSGNNLPMTHDSYGGENQYIGSDIKVVQGVKRAWRLLNVKVGDLYSEDALQHFPVLVSLLNNLPEVQSCMISVLEPGIQIPIHVGYYKGIMRYMIPTHIPKDRENVYLCVNGTKYHWKEGEGVLWDDTYPHKVYNNTNEVRVLIYMDVARPLHNETISWFHNVNRWILKTASGSSIVKDEIKRTEKQIYIS